VLIFVLFSGLGVLLSSDSVYTSESDIFLAVLASGKELHLPKMLTAFLTFDVVFRLQRKILMILMLMTFQTRESLIVSSR
jgi:hypothetical protein